MTVKNAIVMLFSISFFSTVGVLGEMATDSPTDTSTQQLFLSDSDSVEVAERGSGRIEPNTTSSALESHFYG